MIGRASDLHFQGSDQEGLPLWEKIMLILEELFQLVEGAVPVMPRWTDEEPEEGSEPETPVLALQRGTKLMDDLYSGVEDLEGPIDTHGDY